MPIPARSRRALFCLPFIALPLMAQAQTQTQPAPGYEPRRGQPGKDVIWIATPDAAVDRMLQMAELRPADRLVDLGSGDGKIPIAAGRAQGARATGLEFNPELVELSNRRAAQAGLAGRVDFRKADIFTTDFSDATVVTMYLLPELNLRLRPILFRMAPGTRVVSHSFNMGDWMPDETATVGTASLYLWRIPANASGTWRVSAPGLADAPRQFRFSQRFQAVEGAATFDGLQADAVRPLLSGDTLSFGVRDAGGALLQVQARVDGGRMRGTLAHSDGPGQAFEAVRVGEATPIGGVDAGAQEIGRALKVLD